MFEDEFKEIILIGNSILKFKENRYICIGESNEKRIITIVYTVRMIKSGQSVRENREKKKKPFTELKEDGSNFDQWFDQDLGEKMKSWKSVTLEESIKLSQQASKK